MICQLTNKPTCGLTAKQKRALIADELRRAPAQSDRKVAAQFRVDGKTVASVRRQLLATAEIPQLLATVGADGKYRAAGSDERYTPAPLARLVRQVFTIDLDPASCAKANRLIQARRFFDRKANG